MGKRGGLRAELGGEAIYAWVIGEHLRDIKEASRVLDDGAKTYHAAVNEFLSYVSGDIGYYTPAWEQWQRQNLLDATGRPATRLTKEHRRREVGYAVQLLRKAGILGYKRTDFSDDARAIKNRLQGKPAEAAGEDQDDDDTE